MKKIIILISILLPLIGSGQNLVPNPSFEEFSACPSGEDQITFALGWENFSDQSPDYFNVCASNIDFDVPNNWGGYQIASSGDAYSALSAFYPVSPNKREIIGRNLSQTLVIGTKYFFSMKVSLSINSYISSSYACNKLGVRFSTTSYSPSNPVPIDNMAHVWSDSIISDTTNWSTIFGSFVADSTYTYLSIGNFFDDSNTDTLIVSSGIPSFKFAYYYIDDICVSTDSMYTANFLYTGLDDEMSKNIFIVHPNPIKDQLNIHNTSLEPYEINIYNALGQLLYHEKNIFIESKNFNVSTFSNGLFIVNIESNNRTTNYKLLKH